MKWIKASERLPEKNSKYFAKSIQTGLGMLLWLSDLQKTPLLYEWLDESAVPLHQSNEKDEYFTNLNVDAVFNALHQSNDEDEWNKAIDEANKNYKPTVVHPHVQMLEYLKKHFHITRKPDTTIHQTGNQKPDE